MKATAKKNVNCYSWINEVKGSKHERYKSAKTEYSVSSSMNTKKSYTVQICLSPSSSCPDFQKNSLRVFCKHILFLLRYVLRSDKRSELLETRYFSDDDVKVWFYNNQLNAIDQQYVQKIEKSSHNKWNLQ